MWWNVFPKKGQSVYVAGTSSWMHLGVKLTCLQVILLQTQTQSLTLLVSSLAVNFLLYLRTTITHVRSSWSGRSKKQRVKHAKHKQKRNEIFLKSGNLGWNIGEWKMWENRKCDKGPNVDYGWHAQPTSVRDCSWDRCKSSEFARARHKKSFFYKSFWAR